MLFQKGWSVRKVEEDEEDPIASKLWHSGGWLHVCAGIGSSGIVVNMCVAYGIAGNAALNGEFWELVICYLSHDTGIFSSPTQILTSILFTNFRQHHSQPSQTVGWSMLTALFQFYSSSRVSAASRVTNNLSHVLMVCWEVLYT